MVAPNGKKYDWAAVRAPSLRRGRSRYGGTRLQLFDGKDLKGWHAMGKVNQWEAESGVLRSPKSGSNIVTDEALPILNCILNSVIRKAATAVFI